ncbi:MAG: S-layer homology domain-containing protein, partial [Patescibacteria group bacterium]
FEDMEDMDFEDMKDGMKGMMDDGANSFWGKDGPPFGKSQVFFADRLPFDIEEFTALIEEITAIFKEYDATGAKMSMEMDNTLNNFRDNAKKFLEHSVLKAIADNNFSTISEDFKNLINQYDKKDLDDTIKAIAKFWGTGPWKVVQDAWDNLHDSSIKKENPFNGKNNSEDFKNYYGKNSKMGEMGDEFVNELTAKVKQEFLDEIMRTVSDQLMTELSGYFDDQTTKDMIGRIMNNIDVFGEELGNDILENQAYVLKRIEKFDPETSQYKRDKIEELYDRSKNTVIPEKYREELANIWFSLENISKNETGGMDQNTKDAIDGYITKLEKLFKEIEHENVFGEKPVEFYDVKFDEGAWYWKPVVSARNQGIVNGYKDENGLTGYFGPADNVTYAEALKMTMEAAGYHEEPSDDKIWYQAYLDKLDGLNLAELNSATYDNWNAQAKRVDIIVMVNKIFGIQPVEYIEGTFNDVKANDPTANEIMGSSLAGIFTGEGKTGNLNPNGNINRASFAKVIEVAIKYLESTKVVDNP